MKVIHACIRWAIWHVALFGSATTTVVEASATRNSNKSLLPNQHHQKDDVVVGDDDITTSKPLKVFLLSGQSNMVGMGSAEHLKLLINGTSDGEYSPDDYQTLWNGTNFRERDDVYMQYEKHVGKLRPGWFAGSSHGRGPGLFGPEVGLGWVLGDAFSANDNNNETIVLIKAAYGGRSLGIDFRPPSSGEGKYRNIKPHQYGWQYRDMVDDFNNALANLGAIYPDYNKADGYEVSGFVWFQGWNDMLSWDTVNEYAFNLANFIRDVRIEFDTPNLPFVIGELGMAGLHPTGRGSDRHMAMRAAQQKVTLLPEFQTTMLYVPTAPYVHPNLTSYNHGFHYYGRADTYFEIGKAFGRAMLELLNISTSTNVLDTFRTSETTSVRNWMYSQYSTLLSNM